MSEILPFRVYYGICPFLIDLISHSGQCCKIICMSSIEDFEHLYKVSQTTTFNIRLSARIQKKEEKKTVTFFIRTFACGSGPFGDFINYKWVCWDNGRRSFS